MRNLYKSIKGCADWYASLGTQKILTACCGVFFMLAMSSANISAQTAVCTNVTATVDAGAPFTVTAASLGSSSSGFGALYIGTVGVTEVDVTCGDHPSVDLDLIAANGTDTDTCIATVTIMDVGFPTAVCKNITADVGDILIPSDIDNGSSDACTSLSYEINGGASYTVSCADAALGTITLTLEVFDGNANADDCNALVTVSDAAPPVASCTDFTLNLSTGTTISASDVGTFTDNCSAYVSESVSPSTFICGDVGTPVTVTYTVNDGFATDDCTAVVTVVDDVQPTITCPTGALSIDLDVNGDATITEANIIASSGDNCSAVTESLSVYAFDCTNLGTNTVTATATEDVGGLSATCTRVVIVNDVTAPTAMCAPDTVQLVAGAASITAADVNSGSFDNCTAGLSASPTSFVCGDVGTVVVTLTVTDGAGATSTCTANVVVEDNEAPDAICQAHTVTLAGAGNTATIAPANVDGGSDDDCGLLLSGMTVSPNSFDCTTTGAQVVTLEVTDANGNTADCTATVTVNEQTGALQAFCQNYTLDLNTGTTITPADVDGGSVGDCTIALNNVTPYTFDCDSLGANTVTLVVTDDGGANSSTCNATVTVVNPAAPVAACIGNITVQLDTTGNASLVPADIDDGSFLEWTGATGTAAACGSVDLTLNVIDYDCTDVGKTTITETLTATDPVTGSIATCTTTVTVEDMNDPEALCQAVTIELMNGEACVTATMVDNGSTDECNSLILGLDKTNFTCADLGTYTVTMTAMDGSGNTDDCTAVITIEDNTAPTAICQDITVNLDATTGDYTLTAAELNNGSHDQQIPGFYAVEDNLTGSCSVSFVDISVTGTALSHNCDDCVDGFTTVSNYPFYGNFYNQFSAGSNGTIALGTLSGYVEWRNSGVDGISSTGFPELYPFWDDLHAYLGGGYYPNSVIYWEEIGTTLIIQFSTGHLGTDGDIEFQVQIDISGTISFVYTDLDVTGSGSSTFYNDGGSATIGIDNNDGVNYYQYSYNTAQPGLTCITFSTSGAAVDNCTAAADLDFSIPATTFTCSDIAAKGGAGTFAITLTVEDASNNPANCVANVTVVDVDPPVITCKAGPVDVILDATGAMTVDETDLLDSWTDPCLIASFTFSQSSFGCVDIDPATTSDVTVTVGAVDDSGNPAATCDVDVNVIDNTAPDLTCQDLTGALEVEIGSTISTGAIVTSITEVCGLGDVSFDVLTNPIMPTIFYDCDSVGTYPVTVYVDDIYDNATDCEVTVEVVDTSTPNVTCNNPNAANPLIVDLDPSGNASITPPMIGTTTDPACSGTLNVSLSQSSFDCTEADMNIAVVLTATDGGGNTVSCTSYVFIDDLAVEAETTSCPVSTFANPIQVSLDPAGSIQLDADNIATSLGATMTDDCGTAYWSFLHANWSTQNDPCNNSCCSGTFMNYNYGSALSALSYGCADEGTILATAIFPTKENSQNGNIQIYFGDFLTDATTGCSYYEYACNVYIELVTADPVAVCQDITVDLDATGNVTVAGSQVDGGSTDDCNNGFSNLSPDQFDCTMTGPQVVTLTVNDFSGNTDACTATVTVEDNIPPVAMCKDVTVSLDANGDGSVVAADFDDGSSDICGIMSMATDLTTTTFTCVDHGFSTAVVFEVTDNNNNTAAATCQLNVVDDMGPVVTCLVDTISLNDYYDPATGLSIVPKEHVFAFTDNCGVPDQTGINYNWGPCTFTGVPTIDLTYNGLQDVNGNLQASPVSCPTQILGIAPDAMCKDITVGLDASGAATVDPELDLDNGSVNLCDNIANIVTGMMTYTTDMTAFDCSHIGPNTVTLTVTDEDGMSDQCTSIVTIQDLIAPTPVCATGVSVQLDAVTSMYALTAAEIDGGSTDNCISLPSIPSTTFGCADIGAQNVDLTATDPSGNAQTTSCVVNVLEPAPVADCVASVGVTLDPVTGVASIAPADIDSSSYDICSGGFTLSLDDDTFDCSDGSSATVTLTAVDAAGNSSTCTATVDITDPAPVAACQDITVELDATGNYSLAGNESMIDGGSYDVCGQAPLTFALDDTDFDCTDLGSFPIVELTVTDASGFFSSCTAEVTVEDNLGPDMECQDITVYLDAAGNFAGLTTAMIDDGSMDACDGTSISLSIDSGSPTSFDCSNLGNTYTIQLNGVDSNNNLGICNSQVTLEVDPAYPCACTVDYRTPAQNTIADPVQDGLHYANIEIESDATVPANGNVEFKAGNSITLLPGFEVILTAEFLAHIGGCP